MRGFSYVEMLVGMALSTMLVLGFVRYSHQVTNQFLSGRRFQQAHGQLFTAQTALRKIVKRGEPSFWDQFPLRLAPVHAVDHTNGYLQATQECPQAEHGGCLTVWDLRPFASISQVYKLVDQDFPQWVHPTPIADDLPEGPGERFQAGTIMMLQQGENLFPALIAEVAGDEVYLMEREKQPWELPENLGSEGPVTVFALAKLEILHISLTPLTGRSYALRYQPWSYDSQQWQPQQSRTGETHLADLAVLLSDADLPLRVILVAQPTQPDPLPVTKMIGGYAYDEEVYHATLAF